MTVFLAVAHVVVDQVTQALGIQDSGWAIFAAWAAAGAAIATAFLALLTWRSLGQTKQLVAGETSRLQTENTTRLMNDYNQVAIYQSPNANFSAHVATSNIISMSRAELDVIAKRIHELPRQIQNAESQAVTANIGFSGTDYLGLKGRTEELAEGLRATYATLERRLEAFVNSVGIFDNFFKNAHHLLAKDLLNIGLFDLTFALSYLDARKALDSLGESNPVSLGNREIHDQLRAHFKAYLEAEIESGLEVDESLARSLWDEELTATSSAP
jgi:hypothetical protein